MADTSHNFEASEPPVSPRSHVQTNSNNESSSAAPDTISQSGLAADSSTNSSQPQEIVIGEFAPLQPAPTSEPTTEELSTNAYLESREPNRSFGSLDAIVNLSTLSLASQTAVIEELQSQELPAIDESEAENPGTNSAVDWTMQATSTEPLESNENDLPDLSSSENPSPVADEPSTSLAIHESRAETPDPTVQANSGLSSTSPAPVATVDDDLPALPSSRSTSPENFQPAEAALNLSRDLEEPDNVVHITELESSSSSSASIPDVPDAPALSPKSSQNRVVEPIQPSEVTHADAALAITQRNAPSIEMAQRDDQFIERSAPCEHVAVSTGSDEYRQDEPPHICTNCGHVFSASYPPCDCPTPSRPTTSEGLAPSNTNFSFADSTYEHLLEGRAEPRQPTNTQGVDVNLINQEPEQPSRPKTRRGEDPTRIDAETMEGYAQRIVSSPSSRSVHGHSTNPSSSVPTTMIQSPLTPFTQRFPNSSSSSVGSTHQACGCRETGQGEDRQKVFCATHDPNIEENLQSALENTEPSAPTADVSTDSETDAGPHLATLGVTLDEGERHPPVLSVDYRTFIENFPRYHLSPPPGSNDRERWANMLGEGPSTQARAISPEPEHSHSLPPQPTTAPADPVLDAIPGQNSLDTQRSPPPTYNARTTVGRPPGYMSMRPGDENVEGEDSRRMRREQRRAAMRRGNFPRTGCRDYCEDQPIGCRCLGTICDNICDTCGVM